MVASVDDQQVLEPAHDEQLTFGNHTEITGAQPRPGRGARRGLVDPSAEHAVGQLRLLPVAQRNVVPTHPDLTDGTLGLLDSSLRVDDADRVGPRRSVGDQFGAGILTGLTAQRNASRELLKVEVSGADRFLDIRCGHVQGRLRQTVGRLDHPVLEAEFGEAADEPVDRGGVHALSTAEDDVDAAEVEAFHVGVRGAPRGEFEGEVGRAGEAMRVFGHQLDPARGLEQERQRAQQHGLAARHQG